MSDILDKIIGRKRMDVVRDKTDRPLARVQERAKKAAPPRDFMKVLTQGAGARIIAECKKQSPSRGVMAQNYDPVALAKAYEAGGAAAISVLTDAPYFGGSLGDLEIVKNAVKIPVLRKDFIIDEYQIYEARASGADTFLLLSGALDPEQIDEFLAISRSLGMEPLIESHDEAELEAALSTTGKIFGINNRDLKDFSVDLGIARRLLEVARKDAPDRIVVCESGIKTAKDIEMMTGVGYKVFLIGEALVTHPNPQAGLRELLQARR